MGEKIRGITSTIVGEVRMPYFTLKNSRDAVDSEIRPVSISNFDKLSEIINFIVRPVPFSNFDSERFERTWICLTL